MIDMIVGASAARAQALTASNLPVPPAQNVRALIDTGASCTCVDPIVLQALALQPTGTTPMLTPSTGQTPVEAETYDVGILIPNGKQAGLLIPNIAVTATQLFAGQGFHALLGRDILQRCVLAYNGSVEIFTLAY